MKQVMASRTANTRFYLSLLAIFSILSLVLASVGLYGVVAYLVSTRQQEIGVRLALGADRLGIVGMVLREAALPAIGGLLGGIIGALAMARVFQEFLFQVPARDPLVFGSVSFILLATALASAFMPARRASRISPSDSLRQE
jgi:ABC-type antimicrobial peptide transport system permease subunit